MSEKKKPNIKELFPQSSRVLLTGSGRDFVERLGVETTKEAILAVLKGENLRAKTEPLSRQRLTQVSASLIYLFLQGNLQIENFSGKLSQLAIEQIKEAKNDAALIWVAQWLIGLTGKQVQNVLRSNKEAFYEYINDFENALKSASEKVREDMGEIKMRLQLASGESCELDWLDILRLTTAIGSQTLTIRGSDKAIYGKLFEKLILGTALTILGFEHVNLQTNTKTANIFWLSDSSDLRESDATLLFQPGKLARFDIGFIGVGNSEISKDKLSRYAREYEVAGTKSSSVTFIIVDKLPESGKTRKAAENIGAEIIQMSMQYWPRELAQKLGNRLGIKHELQQMSDTDVDEYLASKIANINIQNFVTGLAPKDLNIAKNLPEVEEEIAEAEFE
jgi:hypothetical protein